MCIGGGGHVISIQLSPTFQNVLMWFSCHVAFLRLIDFLYPQVLVDGPTLEFEYNDSDQLSAEFAGEA